MLHTPTIHVARDATHLAWDPAIPPVATVSSGDIVGLRLPRCVERAADRRFGRPPTSRRSSSTRSTRSTARSRSPGPSRATRSRSTSSSSTPANWGWTANIPGFGLLADDFPAPFYKVTAVPGPSGRAEFWPGIHVPLAPFCGEMGVAPLDRAAEHDPARPPWRQHGHPPPGRRLDAVPAGLRAGRPVLDRRRPRDAGRRRGVRDRHRDADAGDGPPHRAQGRPRVGAGVPRRPRPERGAALRPALRHRRDRARPAHAPRGTRSAG